MKSLHVISSKIYHLLEWNSAQKATLLIVICLVTQIQYLVFGLYQLHFSPPERSFSIDMDYLDSFIITIFTLIFISITLLIIVISLGKQYPKAVSFEHLACQYYSISFSFFGYLIGNFTMGSGVVLAGAPLVGMILFQNSVAYFALANAVLIQIGVYLGVLYWDVPYAPIVKNPYLADGTPNPFWVTYPLFFAATHYIILMFGAFIMLSQWRKQVAQIKALSLTDPLTQLNNRRSIITILTKEVARSARNASPLTVVIVDLDHFKKINDTCGHLVGDKALVETANALKESLRKSDHVGRYGGEEFLLILPDTRLQDARIFAERCRRKLEKIPLQKNGETGRVTGSFGLCSVSNCIGVTTEKLLSEADKALYQAKQDGRNRVVACRGNLRTLAAPAS